jgi:hypothetical protein
VLDTAASLSQALRQSFTFLDVPDPARTIKGEHWHTSMSRRAPDLGGRHTHPGRRPCRWLLPRRLRQPSAAGGGTYTIWDHYPQFNTISYWVKLLDSCGTQAGVTVKRTGYEDVRRAGRRQHARVYYDKTVLAKAGVDPAQIKDWTSLTAALGKVKTSDKKASPDQPWTLTLRVPAWCDDVRLPSTTAWSGPAHRRAACSIPVLEMLAAPTT